MRWRRQRQEEFRRRVAAVGERVRDVGRDEHARACDCSNGLVTQAELKLAVEDIPGFLEPLVHMQAGVESRYGNPLGATRSLGLAACDLERDLGSA